MMVRSKMINKRRWLIVLFLTKRYGKMPATIDVPVARILVIRPNHRLGNQLLLTPLLQEIEKLYPAAKVSLLVKGSAAPAIFKSYKLDNVFQLPPAITGASSLFDCIDSKFTQSFTHLLNTRGRVEGWR
jgi:hypothetical protein